jgi:excisionase family DNA binding protein
MASTPNGQDEGIPAKPTARAADYVAMPAIDPATLRELAESFADQSGSVSIVGVDGERQTLPPDLQQAIATVIQIWLQGAAVRITHQQVVLTSQEAADFLGMSRPTLVRLLESGEIPFHTPSRHRRVHLQDLIVYKARKRRERLEILNQLTRDSSIYGDVGPEEVVRVFREIRKAKTE